jgi:hypothetical protein
MTEVDHETRNYALHYDSRLGIGFIRRKSDGAESPLITGSELTELRRSLNRAKTNATSKRKPYRPFAEVADAILSEYFAL